MSGIPPLPHRGPLRFRLDRDPYTLPDVPTPVWLDALVATTAPDDNGDPQPHKLMACWWQLIPLRLPQDQQQRLLHRLNNPNDPLDLDQLEKHVLVVLAAPLGVELHVAQRLIAAARSEWMLFDSWCAAHGIDPMTTHISRLVNIAYRLALESCEKDSERLATKARLWAPPDGVRASGRSWDDDPDITATLDRIESDAFLAMF